MITFLDTDICIAILRGKEPLLEAKLMQLPLSSIKLSSVVVAELWVGVEKSQNPEKAEQKLQTFLNALSTEPFTEKSARIYGQIRGNLEKRGLSIGANDLLIAAIALEQEGTLITRNYREYERIKNLKVEVW
ncbi:MAG: type II toxin-antitoxin system VapC family toxin [Bdellovibrionia bacterium]